MRLATLVGLVGSVGLLAAFGTLPVCAEPAAAPKLALEVAARPHGHGGLELSAVLVNAGGGSLTVFIPERFGDHTFPGWRIERADGATFAPYQPPYQSMWTEGDQGSLVTLPGGQRWRVEHEVTHFLATAGPGGAAVGDAAELTPLPLPPGSYTIRATYGHARAEIPVGLPMFKTTTRPVAGLWTGQVDSPAVTIDVPRPPILSLTLEAPRDAVAGKPYVVRAVVRNDSPAEVRLEAGLVLEASSKMNGTFRVQVPWTGAAAAVAVPPAPLALAPGSERAVEVDLAALRLRGGRGAAVERSLSDALGQGIFHLQASATPAAPAPPQPALTSNGLWRYVVLTERQAR
jgi:hypothetical protein